MNNQDIDVQAIVYSYELGDKPITASFLEVWDTMEPEIRNSLRIQAYEENDLHEIRFAPPDILACPNSEKGIDVILEDGKKVSDRERMFEQLGITHDKAHQLAFYIYHEHCHHLQYKLGKLKAYQKHQEVQKLEKDADEYAFKKIRSRLREK